MSDMHATSTHPVTREISQQGRIVDGEADLSFVKNHANKPKAIRTNEIRYRACRLI